VPVKKNISTLSFLSLCRQKLLDNGCSPICARGIGARQGWWRLAGGGVGEGGDSLAGARAIVAACLGYARVAWRGDSSCPPGLRRGSGCSPMATCLAWGTVGASRRRLPEMLVRGRREKWY